MAGLGEGVGVKARVVVVVIASLTGVLFTAAPVAADDRTCFWDTGTNRLRCINVHPGGDPADQDGDPGSGQSSAPGRWIVWQNDIVTDKGFCADPNTGQLVSRVFLQFLPAGDPNGAQTVASWCPGEDVPIPSSPPSPAELQGLAIAPEPVINISPDGRGMTGLPTYLWGEEPTPLTVGPLSLRGWTVTGRAEPKKWEWTLGEPGQGRNPDPYRMSTTPGSQESPAADYTYETKGMYTVTHTVTYDGEFTLTGPFGVTMTTGIGGITVTASRSYDVIEVRGARD